METETPTTAACQRTLMSFELEEATLKAWLKLSKLYTNPKLLEAHSHNLFTVLHSQRRCSKVSSFSRQTWHFEAN
ncbi:hypothetical protein AQUCO_00200459v1 [Aquilegia coerulea]|uniref:Uncharacterized protein n=1 Tax=Aquilegia coerulea TaxID=218851 RepID=A0A2G5F371_AQUCA|nr:hypothetical protein AQUCO_00200459v1 [Aquilegia coerulea]